MVAAAIPEGDRVAIWVSGEDVPVLQVEDTLETAREKAARAAQCIVSDPFFVENYKELDLSGLDLRTLPAEIGTLQALEELSIESNPLKFVPQTLSQLENLKRLSLDPGQIALLPDDALLRSKVIRTAPTG